MADFEGMLSMQLKIMDCEDPDRRALLVEKLEKLKRWEHPRVTAKLAELRARKLI